MNELDKNNQHATVDLHPTTAVAWYPEAPLASRVQETIMIPYSVRLAVLGRDQPCPKMCFPKWGTTLDNNNNHNDSTINHHTTTSTAMILPTSHHRTFKRDSFNMRRLRVTTLLDLVPLDLAPPPAPLVGHMLPRWVQRSIGIPPTCDLHFNMQTGIAKIGPSIISSKRISTHSMGASLITKYGQTECETI